jgi:hypothetical protein
MHIDDLVIPIKLHTFYPSIGVYLFYLFLVQPMHHLVIISKALESYLVSKSKNYINSIKTNSHPSAGNHVTCDYVHLCLNLKSPSKILL